MNRKKTWLWVVLSALLCAGCENTLPLPDEYMQPLLVMNGLFTPDSLLTVQLTRSRGINEVQQGSSAYPTVEDAEVRLYVDDVWQEALAHVGDGVYRSASFRPVEGQRIRLEAENASLGSVSGETFIPYRLKTSYTIFYGKLIPLHYYHISTSCTDGNCHTDTLGYTIDYRLNMSVQFTDVAEEENYYRLLVEHWDTDGYWKHDYINIRPAFDPSYDMLDDVVDTGKGEYYYDQFSDETFNGQTFRMSYPANLPGGYVSFEEDVNPSQPPPEQYYVRVTIQSISRDYYLYLKTLGQLVGSSLLDDLFAEPVQVYSNINNGIGILGSYSYRSTILPIDVAK